MFAAKNEGSKKKTCLQVGKKRYKIAITSKKKVVS